MKTRLYIAGVVGAMLMAAYGTYAITKAVATPDIYALKVDGVEVMWFNTLEKCREADRDFRVMLSRSNKPSPGPLQCEMAF